MPLSTDLPTGTTVGDANHVAGHNATNTRVNAVATEVNAHEAATTSVHGITNTAALATTAAVAAGYQPLDSDLTALAGLSPSNNDVVQRKAGAWTNRTVAQVKSDFGLAAPPTYAGTRTGVWDATRRVYNLHTANFGAARAALAHARAGTGSARITLIGDSFSNGHPYGSGAIDPGTLLAGHLRGAGYRVGELVHVVGTQTVADARITYTGAWTAGNQTTPYVTRSGSGGTLRYTSQSAGPVVEILTRGTTAAFTVTIDGVSRGAITPSSTNTPQLITYSDLPDTTHTVVISSVTGSNYVAAVGVRPAAGVTVENAAVSGAATDDWQANSGTSGPLPMALAAAPDLVLLELGATDAERGDGFSAIATRLDALTAAVQTAGAAVVLGGSHAPPIGVLTTSAWGDYLAEFYDVADARDVPLMDWTDALGLNADMAAAGLLHDYWHLSAAGLTQKARGLAGVLELWPVAAAPPGLTVPPAPATYTVGAFSSGVTSRSAAVPSGSAPLDVVLLQLYISTTAAVTWPAGFVEDVASPVTSAAPFTHRTAWKRLDTADSGNYTATWTGSADAQLTAARYTGCVTTGNPIEDSASRAGASASTAVPAVEVITLGADRLLVQQVFAFDSISYSGGLTETFDDGSGTYFATRPQGAAGGSGAVAGTGSGSAYMTAWLGALIPAEGVPVGSGRVVELAGLGVPDDGVTDARAALGAVLAALPDGVTVGFPAGRTIALSGNVEVPSGRRLRLLGRGATLKLQPGAASGSYLLSLLGDGSRVEGLVVDGSDVADATGIRVRGDGQTVTDCTLSDCRSGGIYVQGAAAGFLLAGNRFTGNGYGVLTEDNSTAGPGVIEGNRFGPSTRGDAIEINTPNGRAHDITISGNAITGFSGVVDHGIGIGVAHASAITVDSNTISDCLLDGVHVEDDARGVSITDNSITDCGRAAVSVQVGAGTVAPSDWRISDNTITGCGHTSGPAAVAIEGGVAVTDGAIEGNTISGCGRTGVTFYGVDLGYQTADVAVVGNAIRDSVGTTTAGVRASALSRTAVAANSISGHTAGVKMEGATTAVTLAANTLTGSTAALDEASLGSTTDYVKSGNTPQSINDGAALDTRLAAVESVVDPDGVNFPGGMHVLGDSTNKVGYLGYYSNVGAGMEAYRGDHATRAGEFRFIFGGDTDSGSALFIHSDDAQTYPTVFDIRPAGAVTARDVEVTDTTKGIILKSPDGTRYRVTVANGGTLAVTAV